MPPMIVAMPEVYPAEALPGATAARPAGHRGRRGPDGRGPGPPRRQDRLPPPFDAPWSTSSVRPPISGGPVAARRREPPAERPEHERNSPGWRARASELANMAARASRWNATDTRALANTEDRSQAIARVIACPRGPASC